MRDAHPALTAAKPGEGAAAEARWRADVRAANQRRRRVWRSLLTVTFVTAVMVFLTIVQRDAQAVRNCQVAVEYAVSALQQAEDRGSMMPSEFPVATGKVETIAGHYYWNYMWQKHVPYFRPVGVACCAEKHNLFLREDGRHVIFYQDGRFSWVWQTESDFEKAAPTHGLRPAD